MPIDPNFKTRYFRLSLLHQDRCINHHLDFTLFLETNKLDSYYKWWDVIKTYFEATIEEMDWGGHHDDFSRETNSSDNKWPEFENSGYRIWVMKELQSNDPHLTCVDFTPNETIRLEDATKLDENNLIPLFKNILDTRLFNHIT